jgi:uncharacterized protein (TIGR04255 family)
MAEPRQLARPPITEALVDIRILADEGIDPTHLQPLRERLVDRYPKSDEKKRFQTQFRVEAGKLMPPLTEDLGFHGLWLSTSDGSRIVQFRPDGFTFNNIGLGSYIGGEQLLTEALELWSEFAGLAKPEVVVRLALRYINRLDLPLRDGDDFSRFLAAPPILPKGAPQRVSAFLSRIVAHNEIGNAVIVTQKLDEPGSFPVAVLMDVDAFRVEELKAHPENLRRCLEQLRSLKNQTFFSMLTEEAVKLWV